MCLGHVGIERTTLQLCKENTDDSPKFKVLIYLKPEKVIGSLTPTYCYCFYGNLCGLITP